MNRKWRFRNGLWHECFESKLGILEEHPVFINTQPSTQPHKKTFLSQNKELGHRKL